MKANSTRIVALLDASGSMMTIINDMKGGFIQFIEDQKKLEGELMLTAVAFDSRYMPLFEGLVIQKDTAVDLSNYKPGGSTALIESFCKLIDAEGQVLADMKEEDRPEKVLFICITDGQENASQREFSRELLAGKIKHQRESYNWQFVFMGANQDSFAEAASMGMAMHATQNYEASARGIARGFSNLTMSTSSYRSRGATADFAFDPNDQK